MAAPLGNQNAAKGRRWANAVERAMNAWPEKPVSLEINKGLDEAAFEFVKQMMLDKDLGFFREFGDRIDGKPAQAIIGGGEDDPPLKAVTEVVMRGIAPTGS
jgi:hypothetical protein